MVNNMSEQKSCMRTSAEVKVIDTKTGEASQIWNSIFGKVVKKNE